MTTQCEVDNLLQCDECGMPIQLAGIMGLDFDGDAVKFCTKCMKLQRAENMGEVWIVWGWALNS